MEESFRKIVSQIFNNWTALRLAVEHAMGGPNSKQVAIDFMNYIVLFCLNEQNVDVESIQEALEDILDEEFETVCEDDSPKEISKLLFMFVNLLKGGHTEQCEIEFQKLPIINVEWLNQQTQIRQNVREESSDDSTSEAEEGHGTQQETSMETDGWIEVKSRRKR